MSAPPPTSVHGSTLAVRTRLDRIIGDQSAEAHRTRNPGRRKSMDGSKEVTEKTSVEQRAEPVAPFPSLEVSSANDRRHRGIPISHDEAVFVLVDQRRIGRVGDVILDELRIRIAPSVHAYSCHPAAAVGAGRCQEQHSAVPIESQEVLVPKIFVPRPFPELLCGSGPWIDPQEPGDVTSPRMVRRPMVEDPELAIRHRKRRGIDLAEGTLRNDRGSHRRLSLTAKTQSDGAGGENGHTKARAGFGQGGIRVPRSTSR
jgi:hypothetical protein